MRRPIAVADVLLAASAAELPATSAAHLEVARDLRGTNGRTRQLAARQMVSAGVRAAMLTAAGRADLIGRGPTPRAGRAHDEAGLAARAAASGMDIETRRAAELNVRRSAAKERGR